MMTFKEFYLQSSKGDKAPPRASWTSKSPLLVIDISDFAFLCSNVGFRRTP